MWHICSQHELWSQKKHQLLGNSMVTTRVSECSIPRLLNFVFISARELQLKGAGQRGQVSLDTEAEDSTLMEAATKQRD
jgi:hypothetical protein